MVDYKENWKDLFRVFVVAFDLRKMAFGFLMFTLTILLAGGLAYGTATLAFHHESAQFSSQDPGPRPIPETFSPHSVMNWFVTNYHYVVNPHSPWYIKCPFWLILGAVILALVAYFGTAISRIAAVEIARKGERISSGDALGFAGEKFFAVFLTPAVCLFVSLLCVLCNVVAGLICKGLDFVVIGVLIPALLLPLAVIAGFVIVFLIVGFFAGFPLFAPAIGTEGTDCFDAVARGVNYFFSKPLRYIFYQIASVVLGFVSWAVVYLFAVAICMVALETGIWGFELFGHGEKKFSAVTQESWDKVVDTKYSLAAYGHQQGESRIKAFGCLALKHPYGATMVASNKLIRCQTDRRVGAVDVEKDVMLKITQVVLLTWLIVIIGFAYGFGVSYFFTSQTMIYMLLRKKVDDIGYEEIFSDEDEDELPPPITPQDIKKEGGGAEPAKQ